MVVGFAYVISGLLKFIDPLGTELIVDNYFHFLHLEGITFLAKKFGILLCLFEITLGFSVIFFMRSPLVKYVIILTHCVFILLSIILIIWNPQMHCGCLGDAFHLTHWQTFVKNILLLLFILIAFLRPIPRREDKDSVLNYGKNYN